ncbi:MAG TPA: hypothetical protein VIL24_05245 [Clostridia bacterium]
MGITEETNDIIANKYQIEYYDRKTIVKDLIRDREYVYIFDISGNLITYYENGNIENTIKYIKPDITYKSRFLGSEEIKKVDIVTTSSKIAKIKDIEIINNTFTVPEKVYQYFKWQFYPERYSSDVIVSSPSYNGLAYSLKFVGNGAEKRVYQRLAQQYDVSSFTKGRYIISGWALSDGINVHDTKNSKLSFYIKVVSGYSSIEEYADIDPVINEWQYVEKIFNIPYNTVDSVEFGFINKNTYNTVYITNIQISKIQANIAQICNDGKKYIIDDGYKVTTNIFDSEGNLLEQTIKDNATSKEFKNLYSYDTYTVTSTDFRNFKKVCSKNNLDQFTEVKIYHTSDSEFAMYEKTDYISENDYNIIKTYDRNYLGQNAIKSTAHYDKALGNLVKITDANGNTIKYNYINNLLSSVFSEQNPSAKNELTYTCGLLTRLKHNNIYYDFEYDGFGRITAVLINGVTIIETTYGIYDKALGYAVDKSRYIISELKASIIRAITMNITN